MGRRIAGERRLHVARETGEFHEIDRSEGELLIGRTWVGEAPKGARFDRHMEFVGEDGKVRVRAVTQWAIIDKASGRPIRVPPEVIAPFVG